jgi:hypothetical protein
VTQLRLRQGLTIRELPDGDAVVARDAGAEATIINATAAAVLDLLRTPATEAEVARVFCESFPHEDPARLTGDVAAIVRLLLDAGILEPCGSERSTA